MRTLILMTICLAGGLALAQEDEQHDASGVEEIQVRLAYFEQIDVTADKDLAETSEPTDAEIERILEEVEALENSVADQ